MKKVIVSVLLGNYDIPKKAPIYKGWESILFTNIDLDDNLGWKVVKVNTKDHLKDSRYYKWMTHKTLPDYDLVCYMDASMELIKEPLENEMWFSHPVRNNVKDEGKRILLYYPLLEGIIDKQIEFYKTKGFKDDKGLYQNGFFVRRHDKSTNKICSTVYATIKKFCHRDQLALPYALFTTNEKLSNVYRGDTVSRWVVTHRHL